MRMIIFIAFGFWIAARAQDWPTDTTQYTPGRKQITMQNADSIVSRYLISAEGYSGQNDTFFVTIKKTPFDKPHNGAPQAWYDSANGDTGWVYWKQDLVTIDYPNGTAVGDTACVLNSSPSTMYLDHLIPAAPAWSFNEARLYWTLGQFYLEARQFSLSKNAYLYCFQSPSIPNNYIKDCCYFLVRFAQDYFIPSPAAVIKGRAVKPKVKLNRKYFLANGQALPKQGSLANPRGLFVFKKIIVQ
jgi:hypothetical protein